MGGHVFKGTSPIKKERVEPTVDYFKGFLSWVFPEVSKYFYYMQTCGSTGKKEVSGDIDLILDENFIEELNFDQEEVQMYFEKFKKRARTSTDQMLRRKAILKWMIEQINDRCEGAGDYVSDKGISGGALYFRYQQCTKDGATDDWVQIDVNVGDPDWLKFAYYSAGEEDNVKGLHRTQLLLHMFAYAGMVMSHNYGIKNKDQNLFITNNPDDAIWLLNRTYWLDMKKEDVMTYKGIQKHIQTLPEDARNGIYDIYLKTLDSTRCDIPEDLQEYWKDNKERLGLIGKFLPETSNLKKIKQS